MGAPQHEGLETNRSEKAYTECGPCVHAMIVQPSTSWRLSEHWYRSCYIRIMAFHLLLQD